MLDENEIRKIKGERQGIEAMEKETHGDRI